MSRRGWNTGALAALLALVAGACGPQGSGSTELSSIHVQHSASLLQLLEASVQAPWTTAFSGVRRIEALSAGDDGPPEVISYREAVAADGAGRFAIDQVEVLSFLPNPDAFKALQEVREGFLYRYRDFAIRDLDALFENYQILDLDQEVVVAGRTCREVELRRHDGSGTIYRAALDAATGLALRCAERDDQGQLLGLMEFESYDAEPDLSAFAWFVPSPPEVALVPGGLNQQVEFPVLEPSLLPDGYRPWKAATLADNEGHLWLKQTFTDGIEPLFFLHRDAPPPVVVPLSPGGSIASGTGAPSAGAGAAGVPSDELWVYPIGRLTAIEGVLREREVIVLGKPGSEELLDFLEFAVD